MFVFHEYLAFADCSALLLIQASIDISRVLTRYICTLCFMLLQSAFAVGTFKEMNVFDSQVLERVSMSENVLISVEEYPARAPP